MANLVEELGKLNYGKTLAETLANIGRVAGESKRKQEAHDLITSYLGEVFKPGKKPTDILQSEPASMYNQLMQTPEGQMALNSLQQQMSFIQGVDKVNAPIALGQGQDLLKPPTMSTTGEQLEPAKLLYENKVEGKKKTPELIPYDVVKKWRPDLPKTQKLGTRTIDAEYLGYYDDAGQLHITGAKDRSGTDATAKGDPSAKWKYEVRYLKTDLATGKQAEGAYKGNTKEDALGFIQAEKKNHMDLLEGYEAPPQGVWDKVKSAFGAFHPQSWTDVLKALDEKKLKLADIPPQLQPYTKAFIKLINEEDRVKRMSDATTTPTPGKQTEKSASGKPKPNYRK